MPVIAPRFLRRGPEIVAVNSVLGIVGGREGWTGLGALPDSVASGSGGA